MRDTMRRMLTVSAGGALTLTVLLLGLQNRSLRRDNTDLVRRFSKPHPGLLVPAFTAKTLSGVTVAVGEGVGDDRQILFFFTPSCEYCRRSLPSLMRVDSALNRGAAPHTKLYAVAVDSSRSALQQLVDSVRLPVPVLLLPSHRLALLYRVRAVPQLMIVDAAGRTIYAREGALIGPGVVDSIVAAASRGPAAPLGKTSVTARSLEAR
jgi:thiol-disulfide isomerase/thioredoxin